MQFIRTVQIGRLQKL